MTNGYGVEQLHHLRPKNEEVEQNKKNFSSSGVSVIGPGLPMLPAEAGLYCMVQGKVKNDIVGLFYAGVTLIEIAVIFIFVSCNWFCNQPPAVSSRSSRH
jgi:hypothetical protein